MKIEEATQLAGGVIIAGFEGKSADELVSAASKGHLAGVVLFARNIDNVSQVKDLLVQLQSASTQDRPLSAAVDQEGGRVVRLRSPLTVLPPARVLGKIDDPALTERAGRLVGAELRATGFTLDFAPVLDVDTNEDSPVIGDRSYGPTPHQVISHSLAFGRGLRDGGVLPCAKHFPGHGDATADSHVSLPSVNHDCHRLETVEMEPFRAWARTSLGPVMTAHVFYPALDPQHPATSSTLIVSGQLKERLRFAGAILSDDLEMGAVQEMGGPSQVAIRSINAGVDGLLICRSAKIREQVLESLAKHAMEKPAFAQRLTLAGRKVLTLATPPKPGPDFSWIGSNEHIKTQSDLVSRIEELSGRKIN